MSTGGAEFTFGAEPTGIETGVDGGCAVAPGDSILAGFPAGAGSAVTGAELTGGGGTDCVTTGACDTGACDATGGGSTEAGCTVVGGAAGTLWGDAGANSCCAA